MIKRLHLLLIGFGLWTCDSSEEAVNADCPCLNHIQLIGSHNSYKKAVEQPLLDYVAQVTSQSLAESIEYEHLPFEQQLDLGLRSLELDVFYDPDGGHYADPLGLAIMQDLGHTPLPYDEEGKLDEPGLKLFHTQDVDFRSHHLLFTDALETIKAWSDQNPEHAPLFILVEAKDSKIELTRDPVPFTTQGLVDIDTEVQSVFAPEQLITPDQVRGSSTSLREAIISSGWPTIESSRGKILFVLDADDDKTNNYLSEFPNLEKAVMFVNREQDAPEAAFFILNDPLSNLARIQTLVQQGFIVRTLADSETREARTNDLSRFENAQASGAQIISTDYYLPSQLFESSYQVIFEDGSYYSVTD